MPARKAVWASSAERRRTSPGIAQPSIAGPAAVEAELLQGMVALRNISEGQSEARNAGEMFWFLEAVFRHFDSFFVRLIFGYLSGCILKKLAGDANLATMISEGIHSSSTVS